MASDVLDKFHPVVAAWFREAMGTPTPPQEKGWPVIASGNHTLLMAPTGSGKTLAAFLVFLDSLYRQGLDGDLEQGVQVLYISPLKALDNDIYRNLQVPLKGIADKASQMGYKEWPSIAVQVRTGDTPSNVRAAMIRRPPHVLITTPESLYLLLTSPKARGILASVRHVIIDEVHALATNKRGVHLSLSLERLEELTRQSFQRVGLSATMSPLREMARFLGGYHELKTFEGRTMIPRRVEVLDIGGRREMDLQVISPVEDFRDMPGDSAWDSLIPRLLDMVRQHRSTLVFVGNRALAEKLTVRLNDLAGSEMVSTHHGSLSREKRYEIEQQLKEGKLPAIVATSSLELGIDIGAVDLVVQIESPKSVSRGLQRVGRSGHLLSATSKGRLLPKHPVDLLESAVIGRLMVQRTIEETTIPRHCLDVLAQQIVAMASVDEWKVQDLLHIVRRSACYPNFSSNLLEGLLHMLSGRYSSTEFRHLRPRIVWDRANGLIRERPGSRMLAATSGGVIPERGYYAVVLTGDGARLGELDEEFVYESRPGDVFVLGSATWRIERIRHDRVEVSPAPGVPARMPFWHGEGLGRPYELGKAMGTFIREALERLDEEELLLWLMEECRLDEEASLNLRTLLLDQRESTGVLPTDDTMVLELFRDELGDLRLVLHSTFGGRVLAPLALALESRLRNRLGVRTQCVYNDNGIMFRLPDADQAPPLDIFTGLTPDDAYDLVKQEVANTPMFAAAFREAAERALLLPKNRPGRRTPLWLQRLRSRDLMQVAMGHPDFPIVAEAFREVLDDHFDLPALREVLSDLSSGKTKLAVCDTPGPSPLALGLMFDFTAAHLYDGDVPEAERRASLLPLSRQVLDELLGTGSLRALLDPRAIETVRAQLQHTAENLRARNPDELHDLLIQLGDLSRDEVAQRIDGDASDFLSALEHQGQGMEVRFPGVEGDCDRWISSEELPIYRSAFAVEPLRVNPDTGPHPDMENALAFVLRRFVRTSTPFYADDLAGRYGLSSPDIHRVLATLQAEGAVVTGEFIPGRKGIEWCNPEVVRRLRKESMVLARKAVEPRTAPEYTSFLLRWHGLLDGGWSGPTGLREVLGKLQGLYLPAQIWEQHILAPRVKGYQPAWLDQLCASGEVVWAGTGGTGPGGRRLAFYLRQDLPFLSVPPSGESLSSEEQAVLGVLEQHGALFLDDMEHISGVGRIELARVLWELAWKGRITHDGFQPIRNFRSLPQAAQQAGPRRYGRRPPRWLRREMHQRVGATSPFTSGRWSLIRRAQQISQEELALSWAAQLLDRYGVVTRETLLVERCPVPWPELLEGLKALEVRGEAHRGYYLRGLSGIQFARAQAVDALREPDAPDIQGSYLLLSALDPANAYGRVYPLESRNGTRIRFPRTHLSYLVMRRGHPVLLLESAGKEVTTLASFDGTELRQALHTLLPLVQSIGGITRPRARLEIETWDGEVVVKSPVASLLQELGFQREPRSLTLWSFHAERLIYDQTSSS